MERIDYQPIGVVQNEITEPVSPETIRQVVSKIILDKKYQAGLLAINPNTQMMVVYHFHKVNGYDLQQHPRKDFSRPKRGVFALRSPYRPNPIGVTVVNVIKIEENILYVDELDAIDGSPVLDIKPA
jgi:tRNA-Thr(GGU) m(6)t(6)A37 methyltransferase TsaA